MHGLGDAGHWDESEHGIRVTKEVRDKCAHSVAVDVKNDHYEICVQKMPPQDSALGEDEEDRAVEDAVSKMLEMLHDATRQATYLKAMIKLEEDPWKVTEEGWRSTSKFGEGRF